MHHPARVSVADLCILLAVLAAGDAVRTVRLEEDVWHRRPDYPLPVLESGGGIIRGPDGQLFLVVAGGYLKESNLSTTSATYALPLQSEGPWRRLADMPLHLTHVAQAIVNDNMYIAGGFVGQAPGRTVSDSFVFNLPSNTWSRLPSLPQPRAGGGLVYISQLNALFFSSGILRPAGKYHGLDKADSWILFLSNLEAGWTPRASIYNPRNHMSAVAVASRYFFLGGQHLGKESTDNQATMQEYDFKRDLWIFRRFMPTATGHIAASTLAFWNGIIVVGGINNGRLLSNRIYYYDIFSDAWSLVGVFPRNVQSPVCGIAFRLLCCATGAGAGSFKTVLSNKLALPA